MYFSKNAKFLFVLFTFLGNKNFSLYLQSFRISGTLHEDCMEVRTLIQCASLSYVFFPEYKSL